MVQEMKALLPRFFLGGLAAGRLNPPVDVVFAVVTLLREQQSRTIEELFALNFSSLAQVKERKCKKFR